MQQNSGVTDIAGTISPISPFVFDRQVVVTVTVDGGNVPHTTSADMKCAVGDSVFCPGIFGTGRLQPRGETAQVPAVKGVYDL